MQYIYYRIILNFSKVRSNDMPEFTCMLFLTMLEFFNIQSVYLFLLGSGLTLIPSKELFFIYAFSSGVSILVFNLFFLFKRNRIIKKKYQDSNEENKIRNNIFVIGYIVISFVIYYLALDYNHNYYR